MRDLTNKEQILVKALVKKGHPDDPSTIWDVLSSLYKISYAAKEEYRYSESTLQSLSKEERNRVFVEYWHNPVDNNFSRDFQEAISLILELVDKRYLTIKLFGECSDIPLGEKQEYAILLGKEIVSQLTIYNYYQFDLWILLNSHFMATNALVDYSKDFKTEEQRRFKKQLEDSNIKHKEVMIEATALSFKP